MMKTAAAYQRILGDRASRHADEGLRATIERLQARQADPESAPASSSQVVFVEVEADPGFPSAAALNQRLDEIAHACIGWEPGHEGEPWPQGEPLRLFADTEEDEGAYHVIGQICREDEQAMREHLLRTHARHIRGGIAGVFLPVMQDASGRLSFLAGVLSA